ncbi:MAG: chromosomal replication initiator protein DnaA [Verrucomicrobiales bacterium]|nr:chromosomal replication initiator protein DnaA [Verrucomicrobiales bacterium]
MHQEARFDAAEPIEEKALNLIWRQVSIDLSSAIGDQAYERWFSPLNLVRVTKDETLVSVPNSIYSIWVENNFKAELDNSLSHYLRNHGPVKYHQLAEEISEDSMPADAEQSEFNLGVSKPGKDGDQKEKESSTRKSGRRKKQGHHDCPDLEKLRRLGQKAGLNDQYLFDNFVIGDSNQMAAAASDAVSKMPGGRYQPLFIHSGSGLGKTHLLHAIGWLTLELRPNSKVVLLSAESFTNEYVTALQNKTITRFRNKYRKVDLLLIDDVHFLANKMGLQEEFFHTFNSLNDSMKQIVMTSDLPPHEISQLEERLVTRFQWGLATQILQPNEETRTAILRRKRDEWELNVSDSLIDFISGRIHNNVRLLEGALIRCSMVLNLNGGKITRPELEGIIADLQSSCETKRVSGDDIQHAVAEEYDLSTRDLTGRRRTARVAEARHVAMLLTRELTDHSLIEIGESFCRDHGTVIHGINSLKRKMEKSTSIRGTVDKLRRSLTNNRTSKPEPENPFFDRVDEVQEL